jgi:hypothetical protein
MLAKGSTAIDGLRAVAGGRGLVGVATAGKASREDLERADWPIDVLELLFAEILVSHADPVADLIAYGCRDAYPTGVGHGFEPRGHVDAVAEYVALLDNDIAKIDADSVKQAARGGHVAIAAGHLLLKFHGTADCLSHALEFNQHSIACGFDDAALALGDCLDRSAPAGLS